MVGPRNRPPKSCRNGHLDSFVLREGKKRRVGGRDGTGWFWRCSKCQSGKSLYEPVPYEARKLRFWREVKDQLDFWSQFHRDRNYVVAQAAKDLRMTTDAVWMHVWRRDYKF